MKHLVYGVFRVPEGAGRRPGLPEGVECVQVDDLAVAYAPVADEALLPTLPRLRAFARTLGALHLMHTSIPFRFGSALDGPDELAGLLLRRAAHWHELLESVDECDEYSVHFLDDPSRSTGARAGSETVPDASGAPPQADRPGTRYLMSLRTAAAASGARLDQWQARAEGLRGELSGLSRRSQVRIASSLGQPPVSLLLLVPRPLAGEVRAAVDSAARTHRWHVLVTGPWPPFHFVAPPDPASSDRPRLPG